MRAFWSSGSDLMSNFPTD
jgi:hypothetical protein